MICRLLTLALLVATASAAMAETYKAAPAAAAAAPAPIKTLDDLVAFAGAGDFDTDTADFDILFYLVKLVKLPTIDAAVSGTPFTLFAPTDAAFIQTAIDIGAVAAGASEAEAATAIAAALTKLGDLAEIVTTILNYHIATEKLMAADVLNKMSIETFAKDGKVALPIIRGQAGVEMVELTDLAPALPNAKIVSFDIPAFNGVIHAIDRVLLPIGLGGATLSFSKPVTSLKDLKKKVGAGDFDDDTSDFDVLYYLIDLVKLPTFDAAVGGAAFTLFAPNDAAFIATAKDLGLVDEYADEAAAITAIAAALGKMGDLATLVTTILNYHIVPAVVSSTALMNTQEIKTFADGLTISRGQEGAARLELSDNSPALPNAKIYATDFAAFKGVIHAIDRVLLPIALGE